MRATQIRLSIEPGKAGLFYGTSRDLKGLLVAESTPEEVRKKTPETIAAMYHASGAELVDIIAVGHDVWVARPHKQK